MGHGIRVAVPDGDDFDPATIAAEHAALAADPAVQARVARQQAEASAGYPNAIPAEQLYAELGYTPPSQRKPSGRRAKGDSGNVRVRMPRKLHKELAQQAGREGVSLNTLIVTYLAREAGVRSVTTEQA